MSSALIPLAALLHQARWLRFADRPTEEQFHNERQRDGRTRVRVMLVLAILFVAASGLRMALVYPPGYRWLLETQLHYRFFVVAPAWVLALLSTMLPGHHRRAEWVYTSATLVALWGLVVMDWHYLLAERRGVNTMASLITIDFVEVLVLSTFTLPLRFRWQAVLSLGGTATALVFLRLATPSFYGAEIGSITTNLGFAAVATLVLATWREQSERTIFVQREHGRALNAELEKSNAELARLNAEKNEFMAVAAHDLRAPLGVVRGLLELLRDGRIATAEKRATALQQALGETGRMHTLVENYLGAHAAESGALPVRREAVDLGAVAHELVARHGAAANAKRQQLTADAPLGRVRVLADPALLAQVGDNFVTNALKFSPAEAKVRLELHAAPDAGLARLAVLDEGPGVSPAEQGRLFQKFSRGSVRPTAGESSAGLGLAVAKRLADAMGGRVGCDSPVAAGRGACFWVELAVTT